jgi:YidC/Oxa1 family membrane protein insertase
MVKMQLLQPQITTIRAHAMDEGQAAKEIMELYKHENVTAPAGCLPILAQSLIFFGFLKVMSTTIEMRHAPFLGWIQDLSASDPTSVFNLFGLLPFDPYTVPFVGAFAQIGVLPVALGLSLWMLQQKISPGLFRPFKRAMYVYAPLIVTFFFAKAPAGLLIAYTLCNILSIFHQRLLFDGKRGVVGDTSNASAKLLPYGRIQPIVFLMMLAPVIQHPFTFLVFGDAAPLTNNQFRQIGAPFPTWQQKKDH